jgi:hypothetical protein
MIPNSEVLITRAWGTKHPWVTCLDPQTFRSIRHATDLLGFLSGGLYAKMEEFQGFSSLPNALSRQSPRAGYVMPIRRASALGTAGADGISVKPVSVTSTLASG